jgi:hypothetical protein
MTCYLGYPNSDATTVVQITGPGTVDICDDLANPIRETNVLRGAKALTTNDWATAQVCSFTKYGMTWIVWDVPERSSGDCSWLEESV